MFESVAPETFQTRSKRLSYLTLPLSIALHAMVIAAVVASTLWTVAFPEQTPRLVRAYFLSAIPDPPPPPPAPPPPPPAAAPGLPRRSADATACAVDGRRADEDPRSHPHVRPAGARPATRHPRRSRDRTGWRSGRPDRRRDRWKAARHPGRRSLPRGWPHAH